MRLSFSFIVVCLAFASIAQFAYAEFRYDDGGQHTLAPNEPIEPPIIVSNGSYLNLTATVKVPCSDCQMYPPTSIFVTDASLNIDESLMSLPERWVQNAEPTIQLENAAVTIKDSHISEGGPHTSLLLTSENSEITIDGELIYMESHLSRGSRLEVISGTVAGNPQGVVLYDNSQLLINGANARVGTEDGENLGGAGIIAVGQSHVQINNGSASSGVEVREAATLTLKSGWINGNEDAYTLLSYDQSVVQILGGDVSGLWAQGESQVHMAGGVLRQGDFGLASPLTVTDQARARVVGGALHTLERDVADVLVRESATLTIVGSDFNYAMSDLITDLEGTITGTLADGNEFNWTFERDPSATITLIPEPSAITLSALGFLGLLGYRRKRNAA